MNILLVAAENGVLEGGKVGGVGNVMRNIRSFLPNLIRQKSQGCPGTAGRVNVAGPKIGCQQLPSAKDIQRQETKTILIAMEKTAPFDRHRQDRRYSQNPVSTPWALFCETR